jgi:hypothetical protein
MRFNTHHTWKVHLRIFGGFALAFSALTFWVVLNMPPGDWNDWRGTHPYLATLLTFCGPFTAAILRPYAPDSWEAARRLFPCCAAFLLCGAFCQFVPLPFQRGARGLRVAMWVLGLLGWFAGGVLSLVLTIMD